MAKLILFFIGLLMFAVGSAMLSLTLNDDAVQKLTDKRILLWMGISWILISLGYGYVILFVI